MSEKQTKYSIGFTQSVSSGIISFHGTNNFDSVLDTQILVEMLQKQENAFEKAGYNIATRIKPKKKENEEVSVKKDE